MERCVMHLREFCNKKFVVLQCSWKPSKQTVWYARVVRRKEQREKSVTKGQVE